MNFVTWNMQGGTNTPYIRQVINNTGADILCLQECGDVIAQNLINRVPILNAAGATIGYTGQLQFGTTHNPDVRECVFWENPTWTQGALAIISNQPVVNFGILSAVAVAGVVPNNPRDMPWIEINHMAAATGVIRVLSIHGPPVYGAMTIANVCAWDNAQVNQLAGVGFSWAFLGDFNADPTQVGYVAPPTVGANVVRGNHATQQSGGILDYAVTNAAFNYVQQTQLCGASDHYPQVFSF